MFESTLHWVREHPWPLGAGLTVLVAVYVMGGAVWPRVEEARALWATWEENEAALRRATHWEEELRRIAVQRQRLRRRYVGQVAALDSSGRVSTALEGLQEAADEADVTLQTIRPGEPMMSNAYSVRRITARVTGRFPAIVRFVRAIETGSPFVNVTGFTCRSREDPSTLEARVIGLAVAPRPGLLRAEGDPVRVYESP